MCQQIFVHDLFQLKFTHLNLNLMQADSRSVVPQAPAIMQSVKIEHENITSHQNKDARVAGVRSI